MAKPRFIGPSSISLLAWYETPPGKPATDINVDRSEIDPDYSPPTIKKRKPNPKVMARRKASSITSKRGTKPKSRSQS
jgi:hypothetical protein